VEGEKRRMNEGTMMMSKEVPIMAILIMEGGMLKGAE
jgi:hypothetical protein